MGSKTVHNEAFTAMAKMESTEDLKYNYWSSNQQPESCKILENTQDEIQLRMVAETF